MNNGAILFENSVHMGVSYVSVWQGLQSSFARYWKQTNRRHLPDREIEEMFFDAYTGDVAEYQCVADVAKRFNIPAAKYCGEIRYVRNSKGFMVGTDKYDIMMYHPTGETTFFGASFAVKASSLPSSDANLEEYALNKNGQRGFKVFNYKHLSVAEHFPEDIISQMVWPKSFLEAKAAMDIEPLKAFLIETRQREQTILSAKEAVDLFHWTRSKQLFDGGIYALAVAKSSDMIRHINESPTKICHMPSRKNKKKEARQDESKDLLRLNFNEVGVPYTELPKILEEMAQKAMVVG